jgi:hypothetical protein
MGEVGECDELRRLLKNRLLDMSFIKDDDINKLVAQGFTTEDVPVGTSKDDLLEVLPSRRGVVIGLLLEFGGPTGMFPHEGFAVFRINCWVSIWLRSYSWLNLLVLVL